MTTGRSLELELAEALLAAAEAHESGRVADVENEYEEFESRVWTADIPLRAKIALRLWDGWIDGRNHDWRYYEGIAESDWPRLARLVADDLRSQRDVTDATILGRFDLPQRKAKRRWWSRRGGERAV